MPFVETNGINLYYEERGDPSASPLLLIMVLLHLVRCGSLMLLLEKDFRCVLPDNRGVGYTDKPAGDYTTAQMADDCAGLLEALGIETIRVVGCSMGSTIALQLAIRHPQKVQSMVLMCPWARCDNTAKAIFQHIMTCKARLRPEKFSLFIQLLIYSKGSWDDEKVAAELEEGRRQAAIDAQPQPLHGLEGQAAACISHNVLTKLPSITQPTLVIGGQEDIFTPAWIWRMKSLPHCDLYLYEKAGHVFHFERLNDFNPRVRDWLLEN
ncbi:MAG: alpha/beta hydrolase [Spirosomataceae bacterium]